MSDPNQTKLESFLTHVPTWFLLGSALIYATGFLTVQLFHDSYGLRGLNTELFKIRYAHVGILFAGVPLLIGGYVFGLCYWFHRTPQGSRLEALKGQRLSPVTMTASFFIIAHFGLVVVFAPPGTFSVTQPYLLATVGVILIALITSNVCQRYNALRTLLGFRIAWTFVFLAIILLTGRPFADDLYALTIPVGLWFGGLSAFLGLSLWLIIAPPRQQAAGEMKTVRNIVAVIFLSLLYYLLIAAFGYGMFHHIPAGKGGGDFTHAGLIELAMGPDASVPDWLYNDNDAHRLVLVEATDAAVFVANPAEKLSTDANGMGPAVWRMGRSFRPNSPW